MHITVLLQHYHTPDCATAARPWSLVRALARRHEVTVLTTDAWRARRLTHDFDWCPDGVHLQMLEVPYANKMSIPRRFRSYLTYAGKALWRGLRLPAPDLVYASSTPLTVGAAGAALARLRGCPFIFEVRDLWPDFPVQMGALAGHPLLQRPLYALEHVLYRRAARVVTASPDMAAHVRCFTDGAAKVSSVPYGTDFEILEQVKSEDTAALNAALDVEQGGRVVLYAGSFGRANALPTVVEAARQMRERSDVCFVFAGRGYHRPMLAEAARALPNVRLLGPQPYRRSLALFRRADLSLVPFLDRPVLAANAPSKLFDSLAAGTPVVVTNPGWTKALVEAQGCGWYAPAEQPRALARCIAAALRDAARLRRVSARAQRTARRRFDRRAHMNEILAIIAKAAA